MNRDSRVLITGGTGFLGSRLTDRLRRDGWDVHLLMRQRLRTGLEAEEPSMGVTVHEHDGTTENAVRIVCHVRPRVVVHLAALFVSNHEVDDVLGLVRSNIEFGTQILEACTQAGVMELIHTGTSWQYSNSGEFSAPSLYASTKQAFQCILRYYATSRSMRCITLLLYDTYGEGDPRQKIMALFSRLTQTGEHLAMSPGEQKINLLHVDDIVEAFLLALRRVESSAGYEEFVVRAPDSISLRDLASAYERLSQKKLYIEWGARDYRPLEIMEPWNGGRALPGWARKVSLEDGIIRMLGMKSE